MKAGRELVRMRRRDSTQSEEAGTSAPLVIDSRHLIGQGEHRQVFRHPTCADVCVKVEVNDLTYSPTEKEIKYYAKLRWIKPNYAYTSIARCYGWVETDRGRAGAFELIRDELTGECAPTLHAVLERPISTSSRRRLADALRRFRDDLLENAIPVRDLHSGNLCVQRRADGSCRIVAVDAVGHRDALPLVDVWAWFGRRKVWRYLCRYGLAEDASIEALVRLAPAPRSKPVNDASRRPTAARAPRCPA